MAGLGVYLEKNGEARDSTEESEYMRKVSEHDRQNDLSMR